MEPIENRTHQGHRIFDLAPHMVSSASGTKEGIPCGYVAR